MARLGWIVQGLRTGIVTTAYPSRSDVAASAGLRVRPVLDRERCQAATAGCDACVRACLPRALTLEYFVPGEQSGAVEAGSTAVLALHLGKCIGCGLCALACPHGAITMTTEIELATRDADALRLAAPLTLPATPTNERGR